MIVDARFEELYRQVELVRGAGERQRGRLCLMSLAAFLAGEGHSDNPASVSAVIRRFAVPINDGMPAELRQQLKPFAPLIIGTRDGHDCDRAALLIAVMRTELLPRMEAQFGDTVSAGGRATPRAKGRVWSELYHQVTSLLSKVSTPTDVRGCEQVATAATRLICFGGRMASLPDQRAWYWAKAVDVLDRLCAVGEDDSRPEIPDWQVSAVNAYLQERHGPVLLQSGYRKLGHTWIYARRLLPVLVR